MGREGGRNKPIFFTSPTVHPWSPSECVRPRDVGLSPDHALVVGGGKARSLNASSTTTSRTSMILILTTLSTTDEIRLLLVWKFPQLHAVTLVYSPCLGNHLPQEKRNSQSKTLCCLNFMIIQPACHMLHQSPQPASDLGCTGSVSNFNLPALHCLPVVYAAGTVLGTPMPLGIPLSFPVHHYIIFHLRLLVVDYLYIYPHPAPPLGQELVGGTPGIVCIVCNLAPGVSRECLIAKWWGGRGYSMSFFSFGPSDHL